MDVTNESKGVTVAVIVSGNSFTIDDSFVDNGQAIEMDGSGTYTDTDGDIKNPHRILLEFNEQWANFNFKLV